MRHHLALLTTFVEVGRRSSRHMNRVRWKFSGTLQKHWSQTRGSSMGLAARYWKQDFNRREIL